MEEHLFLSILVGCTERFEYVLKGYEMQSARPHGAVRPWPWPRGTQIELIQYFLELSMLQHALAGTDLSAKLFYPGAREDREP